MPALASGAIRSSVGRLRVFVTDERGRRLHAAGLGRWLARIAPARARGSVTVALVSDRRVRVLNHHYRGKDYPTDVLSFPFVSPAGRRRPTRRPRRSAGQGVPAVETHLGDIVIARGVAARQARTAGHSAPEELRVLALHGLLHLLGYDHERDRGQMARLERKLRRKGGLSEALTERQ